MRPCRLVDQSKKKEEPKKDDDIKLFDFGTAEIKESFVNNPDAGEPLDSHKLYLNIVYHDRVLPPLNKEKSFADPKQDKTWALIPVAFSAPVIRKSLSGQVYTYDGHVNPCVMKKMKENKTNFQNILHYIITKF